MTGSKTLRISSTGGLATDG